MFPYLQMAFFPLYNHVSPSKLESLLFWKIMCDVHVCSAPFLLPCCSVQDLQCLYLLSTLRIKYTPLSSFTQLLELVPTMVTTYGCGIGIMADLQHRHLMTCCAWYKFLKQHPSRFSSQGRKCFKEWPSSAPARQPGKFLFAIEFLTSNRQYLNLLRT